VGDLAGQCRQAGAADQAKDVPVFLGYRHSPVGTAARNTIHAASRLLLPVLR
jgi:hypothetical protein